MKGGFLSSQIRKYSSRPFGYVPVKIQFGKKPSQQLFLLNDERHTPAVPPRFIEITETQEQAQDLLEFNLHIRLNEAEAGRVIPVKLDEALMCLTKLQIALPSSLSNILKKLSREVQLYIYAKGHKKEQWKSPPLRKTNYHLIAVTDDDHDQKSLHSLISLIRKNQPLR